MFKKHKNPHGITDLHKPFLFLFYARAAKSSSFGAAKLLSNLRKNNPLIYNFKTTSFFIYSPDYQTAIFLKDNHRVLYLLAFFARCPLHKNNLLPNLQTKVAHYNSNIWRKQTRLHSLDSTNHHAI